MSIVSDPNVHAAASIPSRYRARGSERNRLFQVESTAGMGRMTALPTHRARPPICASSCTNRRRRNLQRPPLPAALPGPFRRTTRPHRPHLVPRSPSRRGWQKIRCTAHSCCCAESRDTRRASCRCRHPRIRIVRRVAPSRARMMSCLPGGTQSATLIKRSPRP